MAILFLIEVFTQVVWTLVAIVILFGAVAIVVADGVGWIQLWGIYFRLPFIVLLSSPITLSAYLIQKEELPTILSGAMVGAYFLIATYALLQLHFFPDRKNRKGKERYIILHGAKTQLSICGLYVVVKTLILGFSLYCMDTKKYPVLFLEYYPTEFSFKGFLQSVVVWDAIFVCILIFLVCVNASLRVLVTSKRLGFWRRVITFLGLLVPIVNLYFIYRIYKISKEEYIVECERAEFRKRHIEVDLCATKYPIVLVHGMAFRDFQYVNYWGRIPQTLKNEGATVYYGHQAAVGTIEHNALHIKEMIEDIIEKTQCEKVNIIAHSKGGLDTRYMISELHMGDKIASVTTISTPHRGSRLVEVLERFPDKWYRLFTNYVDRSYQRLGDKNPDCYHASKQLSKEYMAKFNEYYENDKRVHYQSYACAMKFGISDTFFFFVHTLLKLLEKGPNDGLVAESSAKWGVYRGCFKNKRLRGISHGDIIDIRRDDIFGFDILEAYIQMVRELKEMGY